MFNGIHECCRLIIIHSLISINLKEKIFDAFGIIPINFLIRHKSNIHGILYLP